MTCFFDAGRVRELMNRCGARRRPFLFAVNFEMTEGLFAENPLACSSVGFSVNGVGNREGMAGKKRERCGAAGGAADGVRRICPPFRNGAPRSAARRFVSDQSDGTYSGRFGAVAGGDFHAGRGALPARCAGTVRLFFAGTFRAYRRRSYRYQSDERHHQCFRARCPADDTE